MKIKEVKYGMEILINVGNYENVRKQIEVTAEVEEGETLEGVAIVLKNSIEPLLKEEYIRIKNKSK